MNIVASHTCTDDILISDIQAYEYQPAVQSQGCSIYINDGNENFIMPPLFNFPKSMTPEGGHSTNITLNNTILLYQQAPGLPGTDQRFVLDNVVKFDGKCMEKHFRMCVSFDIIHRLINLFHQRLLL